MREQLYIYLAGNIKKGKEDEHELVWNEQDMELLRKTVPSKELIFLNPAVRTDDLSDQKSVFGRDLFQVYSSGLVLVDARDKRGLGVGAEMMFAKMKGIPVVAWVPPASHYQRETIHFLGQRVKSWVHPFVENLADYLAPSLEAAGMWIEQELFSKSFKVKDVVSIKQAMEHYLTTQLKQDDGMRELVASQSYLQQKLKDVHVC